jgi:hypothetical protein
VARGIGGVDANHQWRKVYLKSTICMYVCRSLILFVISFFIVVVIDEGTRCSWYGSTCESEIDSNKQPR